MYINHNTLFNLVFFFCFLIIQNLNAQAINESSGIMTDIDGNVYNTVTIGNQTWMKENLKVTRYRNGDSIQHVTSNTSWAKLKTGAWCIYDNNENLLPVYGRLYNWYAVTDKRDIAPEGWHIPTNEEIFALAKYLGGYEVAGGKLKEADTIHWKSPNIGADDSSGFTALPAGTRFELDGSFGGFGSYGLFWTESSNGDNFAWKYSLDYDKNYLVHNYYYKWVGYSVRCVKDKN